MDAMTSTKMSSDAALKSAATGWPDMTQIITTAIDVYIGKKNKEQAVKEILLQCRGQAVLHLENTARQKIEDMLRQSSSGKVQALSEKDFADRLVRSSKDIAFAVSKYYKNDITLQELLDAVFDTGIKDIANDVVVVMGIPEKFGVRDLNGILNLSAYTVGYTSMMEVYKELMKAIEDDRIAHERRLQIEAECAQAVAAITQYRRNMEQVVSDYLKFRYDTFEVGFQAMDKAILEGDIDGYLGGNAAIQKVLEYDVQFETQDEFVELMMSGEAFKF